MTTSPRRSVSLSGLAALVLLGGGGCRPDEVGVIWSGQQVSEMSTPATARVVLESARVMRDELTVKLHVTNVSRARILVDRKELAVMLTDRRAIAARQIEVVPRGRPASRDASDPVRLDPGDTALVKASFSLPGTEIDCDRILVGNVRAGDPPVQVPVDDIELVNRRDVALVWHNAAMMYAGGVITLLVGVPQIVLGAIAVLVDQTQPPDPWGHDKQGLATGLIGLPSMGIGALMMALGIPLWVVGGTAELPPASGSATSSAWLRPSVSVGAGALQLRWSF